MNYLKKIKKLFLFLQDHIEEIVSKWNQIDDEIWAKIICMERNRRVAKAYARAPILTINGSDIGFDGHRIGLNGFNNPMRDRKVASVKATIDMEGVKIRMDEHGSLLVKRLCKNPVYLRETNLLEPESEEKIAGTNDSTKKLLPKRTSVILFDMVQFQTTLAREVKYSSSISYNSFSSGDKHDSQLPLLQQQCFAFLSFGKLSSSTSTSNLLNTPLWVIVINLVALEMLLKVIPPSLHRIMFTNKNQG